MYIDEVQKNDIRSYILFRDGNYDRSSHQRLRRSGKHKTNQYLRTLKLGIERGTARTSSREESMSLETKHATEHLILLHSYRKCCKES
jgi:hypothetical protein